MRKQLFLFVVLFLNVGFLSAQTFKLTVDPPAVVKGEQFRIEYTLVNAEGRGIKMPQIDGCEILYGPSVSQMSNYSNVNGQVSSQTSETYTYILMANKEGVIQIPAATITSGSKTLTSNTGEVKVLPPDKNAQATQVNGGAQSPQRTSSSSSAGNINSNDVFIRVITSKTKIHEQEALMVTFRFYTTLQPTGFDNVQFPEFDGFMVEDLPLSVNRQMTMENYKGRNYYAIDFKKSLLFPQRSGKITIPAGKVDVMLSVRSGQQMNTFFGPQDIMVERKKTMPTSPLTIDVLPLPENKPDSYANAVGKFTLTSSITSTKIKVNEAITLSLNISGTGNMKLLKTPEIKFPSDFETYDPKVKDALVPTPNGLTGFRKIDYLFIPRHEGEYTIPASQFTYYDVTSGAYKTLETQAYKITVAKDPNASLNDVGTSYTGQTVVKVDQDIRFLKLDKFSYQDRDQPFFGSLTYILWYIIPLLLLTAAIIFYRKQIKENADVTRMRTRKALKVARKRLKLAGVYLAAQNKENFYEEVLRAIWGYLSDKLTIPLANLDRDNIEIELTRFGASKELVAHFISILDTCEFARYSSAGTDDVSEMDNFYNGTIDAIGKMENTVKIK